MGRGEGEVSKGGGASPFSREPIERKSEPGLKEVGKPAQEAKFQTDLSVGFCSRGRKVNMSSDGFPSGFYTLRKEVGSEERSWA